MKKKFLTSFFLTISLVLINVSAPKAVTTNTDIDFNNRLINGTNIAYMIHPGNEYTSSIPNAVHTLMYPSGLSNNLVLNQTNDYMTSKMDLYQYSFADGNNAYTSVFRKNTSGSYENSTKYMDSYDWVYGEIRINDSSMGDPSMANKREDVIIHEMLHVYGLKDVCTKTSIMYFATPLVTGVTGDANTVLNNKY
ncbi:MAG: hypothetical protein ACRDA5_00495 [Clostridium sp.]